MSKYFYHGLGIPNEGSMTDVITILQTGGIKCKRLLNMGVYGYNGYNGLDYVSVCQKYPEEEYERYKNYKKTAFYRYVYGSFCFVISNEVEAIKTETIKKEYIPKTYGELLDLEDRMEKHPEVRYSDMFDEWQIRDEVPLSSIIGIGIPMKWLQKTIWNINIVALTELKELFSLINALGLDVVDSSKDGFAEEYELEKEKGNKVYQFSLNDVLGEES